MDAPAIANAMRGVFFRITSRLPYAFFRVISRPKRRRDRGWSQGPAGISKLATSEPQIAISGRVPARREPPPPGDIGVHHRERRRHTEMVLSERRRASVCPASSGLAHTFVGCAPSQNTLG